MSQQSVELYLRLHNFADTAHVAGRTVSVELQVNGVCVCVCLRDALYWLTSIQIFIVLSVWDVIVYNWIIDFVIAQTKHTSEANTSFMYRWHTDVPCLSLSPLSLTFSALSHVLALDVFCFLHLFYPVRPSIPIHSFRALWTASSECDPIPITISSNSRARAAAIRFCTLFSLSFAAHKCDFARTRKRPPPLSTHLRSLPRDWLGRILCMSRTCTWWRTSSNCDSNCSTHTDNNGSSLADYVRVRRLQSFCARQNQHTKLTLAPMTRIVGESNSTQFPSPNVELTVRHYRLKLTINLEEWHKNPPRTRRRRKHICICANTTWTLHNSILVFVSILFIVVRLASTYMYIYRHSYVHLMNNKRMSCQFGVLFSAHSYSIRVCVLFISFFFRERPFR